MKKNKIKMVSAYLLKKRGTDAKYDFAPGEFAAFAKKSGLKQGKDGLWKRH